MIKWLLVIGVVVAVYYFFIKKKPSQSVSKEQKSTKAPQEDVEEMVQCSRCEVYVEIKEAIVSNGKYFCSQTCLKG